MMRLSEAAGACQGRLEGENVVFSAVDKDTRIDLSGALYVALRGERFDGHAFVADAQAAGAIAALVAEDCTLALPANLPVLRVADTRIALGQLAAYWRQKFSLPVIGITGSNGKTSVKEMCAAILRTWASQQGLDPAGAVLATQGNLNNDIGLPLMLLRLRATHIAAVFEMGMNHPGEIGYLTEMAQPTVALVNNAQRAHLEGMGDLLGVAEEKGQIYRGLADDGVALVNADDAHAGYWRGLNVARQVVSFGLADAADVHASYQALAFGSQITLHVGSETRTFSFNVPGEHNVRNAAAAAAATLAAGVNLEVVAQGLASYQGTQGRLQLHRLAQGAVILDDTYNANPDSVRAGIDVLAATPGKKVLVLGDMGEIGERSAQYHDEIGGYAKSQGVDRLLALGPMSEVAVRNFAEGAEHFTAVETLLSALRALLAPDVVVLVKGSRFMRMERVVSGLIDDKNYGKT